MKLHVFIFLLSAVLTKLIGYFLGIEVHHQTEIDALIDARNQWLIDPENEGVSRRQCPRIPKYTEAGFESNWNFTKSYVRTRFIGRDFLNEAFQYQTRNFGFEYIIKLLDEGIERLHLDLTEFDREVYNDKWHLLEVCKDAIQKFRDDRHLNQIFPSRHDPQSPKDYAKEAIIKLMKNSIEMDPIICDRRVVASDDESVTDSLDSTGDDPTDGYIDKIVRFWFGGFESYQNYDRTEKKEAFFIKSLRKIMSDMKPEIDFTNLSPESPIAFSQDEMVECWQKLIVKINDKISSGKSSLSQRYVKCCLRFAELGFQTLTACKTTLELERNGFINYYSSFNIFFEYNLKSIKGFSPI